MVGAVVPVVALGYEGLVGTVGSVHLASLFEAATYAWRTSQSSRMMQVVVVMVVVAGQGATAGKADRGRSLAISALFQGFGQGAEAPEAQAVVVDTEPARAVDHRSPFYESHHVWARSPAPRPRLSDVTVSH